MKTPLFNLHDIVLILVLAECLILCILLLLHPAKKKPSHHLLAALFLMNALIAIDILTIWGDLPRLLLARISSNLFLLFGFAYFLQGPALLFYTKSLIYKNFRLRRIHALHLLPALFFPVLIYSSYIGLSVEQKLVVLQNPAQLFSAPLFAGYVWAIKIFPVIYGFSSLYHLIQYRVHLYENFSNLDQIKLGWLGLLIGGFQIIWLWILLTRIAGSIADPAVSDAMGLTGNYLTLILINALVFYGFIYGNVFARVTQYSRQYFDSGEPINSSTVVRIENAMQNDKLYLNPRLTLEEFSEKIGLSYRLVSTILNRHFKQNFFEYVNQYRIQEVQNFLSNPQYSNKSMMTIFQRCGFNSKATFNRFFKKHVGLTPTEYRKKKLPKSQ